MNSSKKKKSFLRAFKKILLKSNYGKAFTAAETPLSKLSHPIFGKYLEKNIKNLIPNQTTLGKL